MFWFACKGAMELLKCKPNRGLMVGNIFTSGNDDLGSGNKYMSYILDMNYLDLDLVCGVV